MIVFPLDGECLYEGIWSSITSARSFNKLLLDAPPENSYFVRYTTGGTAALKPGEILTGGTSAAKAYLVSQAVENGTAGSGDSGIVFLRVTSGTPTPTGETWTGGTSTGTIVTAQSPIKIGTFPNMAKAALITVETAPINFTLSGTVPTVAAGTNYGDEINTGQSYVIRGENNLRRFACINTVNASGAIVKYKIFF